MSKHTPGPWRAAIGDEDSRLPHEDKDEVCLLPSAVWDAVCVFATQREGVGPHSNSFEEFSSNARLIAAAPELYEALAALIGDVEAYHVSCTCSPPVSARERANLENARAALLKAGGGDE